MKENVTNTQLHLPNVNKSTKKILDITDDDDEIEGAPQSGIGLSFLGND